MKYNTASPFFPEEDIDQILEKFRNILAGNGMLTMGDYVAEFEREYAKAIGVKYAIATNSCTTSLEISLKAIGLRKDDEVIVPVQTFFATGSSVVNCDSTPIFCEINKDFLIDFEQLKKLITPKTRAVIIVHFLGLIHSEIFEIREYLRKRNICLIEDAAHAHGARIDNVFAGNIGDIGCHSFFSTKILTTGEGGMVTTNNEQYYKYCSSMRNRGLDVDAGFQIYNNPGNNGRLTEIQGLLGIYQVRRMEEFVNHRNKVADIYGKVLRPLIEDGVLRVQVVNDKTRHAYWRYVIFFNKDIDRNKVIRKMAEYNIKADTPYTPLLHLQPFFIKLYKTYPGMLEYSEKLSSQHICIPMHTRITPEDADYIASSLIEVTKNEY